MKIKYPNGIKAVYDNGGQTVDRYTVYYLDHEAREGQRNAVYPCVGMSSAPFHPLGFGQHCDGMLGRHNGKRIAFEDLPSDCQKLVRRDLK